MGPFVLPPTTVIESEHPDRARTHAAALPRAGRWCMRVAVLLVGIAGPTVAFAAERDVVLDLEGTVRTVQTYAADATDLLERKGLKADKADLLTAGALKDGGTVTYRKAKSVRLVLDGERKTVVARGLTVGQAVKDLGLVPGPEDLMHPPASTKLRSGLSIYVRNAIHAKLRVDGALRDVVSSADTVENLIKQAGVAAGPNDYIFPAKQTEPTDGMWVRVVRVRRVVEAKNIRVPYRVVTQRDSAMDSGVRKVVQQGSEGLKVQRFSILLEDGRRVQTRMTEEKVLRSARDHIVRVGSREPSYKGGGGKQSGVASWFQADGLVAAHRSLPLGSVVKVTAENGKSVTVRINQRGPFVDGRVIDLSDDAFQRLAPLGAGTVKVTIQS